MSLRFPQSTAVRKAYYDGLLMRFDQSGAITLLEGVPAGQRTKEETTLLAVQYLGAGRYADAEVLMTPLLESDSKNLRYLRIAADAFVRQGKNVEGAELLDANWQLIEQTKDPTGHYLRGLAHYQQGELEAATARLQECLELRPRHATAHYTLARVFAALGDAEAAESHQKAFLQITEAAEARLHRNMRLSSLSAQTNLAFKEGRYGECEQLLKESMVLADPKLKADLYTYLNRVYVAMGRPTEAQEALREAARWRRGGQGR